MSIYLYTYMNVFPFIRIQETSFLSVCHKRCPVDTHTCNMPTCTSSWYQRDEHHLIFISHVWCPLDVFWSFHANRYQRFVKKAKVGQPVGMVVCTNSLCFLVTFPLPDAKSCISEPSATWGQNGAPADVMLEELGSPSERGDLFVPVGHLVNVRQSHRRMSAKFRKS